MKEDPSGPGVPPVAVTCINVQNKEEFRGNMFLMQFHYWLSKWSVDWNGFSKLPNCRGLNRPNKLCLYESNKCQPLWTKDNLVNIMTKLVNSDGYLMYADFLAPQGDVLTISHLL